MASPKLPRVLMLHGYTQNASIFAKRVAALRKACKNSCEMVFVDAPLVVAVPSAGSGAFDAYDSSATSPAETDPELIPRAWWKAKDSEETGQPQKTYVGLDDSLCFLRDVVDRLGPFDACLGFSQGAALAAVLALVLARPSLHPAFSSPSREPLWQGPLKAVVMVAGFKLELEGGWYAPAGGGRTGTPNLHVLGRADTIVGQERTSPLVEAFDSARVEYHDGGHHVPAKKSWRDFFARYFAAIRDGADLQSVPGPGGTAQEASVL